MDSLRPLRRNWWLVLLLPIIAAAGATAYSGRGGRASSFTATSRIQVVVGATVSSSSAGQASQVARAYAVSLLDDQRFLAFVADRVHLAPALVAAMVSSIHAPGASVFRIGFRSNTATRVRSELSAATRALTALSPRSDVVGSGTVEALTNSARVSRVASGYRGSVAFAIPVSALTSEIPEAFEAISEASAYADTLADSGSFTSRVVRQLPGRDPQTGDTLSVAELGQSSIVLLHFTADSREAAIAGANEAASLLTSSDRAIVSGIPADSFEPLSLATRPSSTSSRLKLAATLPIAVLFGLVLGVILALARARADPRVETPRRLANLVSAPCSPIGDVQSGDETLLSSWDRLSANPLEHPRLLVLPVDSRTLADAQGLSAGLSALGWSVEVASEVATDASNAMLAVDDASTLRILLAAPATKAGAVMTLVSALSVAGARPSWAILT
jgi:capsular polysaccharide biosynthesis protein